MNCNDGSQRAPYLRTDINGGNLFTLPAESSGPKGDPRAVLAAVKAAGFTGVQGGDPALCRELGLGCTGGGKITRVGEIDAIAARQVDQGIPCATLHVGTGHEDDDQAHALIEDVLAASQRRKLPLYIETHRATITQDTWRTVQFARRYPEMRFNGDFSHWYTGLEMVYGDIKAKFDFLAPVFERTRFIHGRIGDPGAMQVDIGDGSAPDNRGTQDFVGHFREMWTRSFAGFLRSARPGDYICFTPELLPPGIYYARTVRRDGVLVEEGDRWQQALVCSSIARACFAAARAALPAAAGQQGGAL